MQCLDVRIVNRVGYLFNDPLEDTEMLPPDCRALATAVTCSTIR